MASQLYPKGKKAILDGDIDLLADDIRAAVIDTADETFNNADEFYSDLASASIVGETPNLTGKTTTGGVFDADNTRIEDLTGDGVEAMVIYKWTGSGATSRLIAWIDIATYNPFGAPVAITWNASGIFAI